MSYTRSQYTKTNKASVVYLSCTGDTAGYRYGFNSMSKDNEIYGEGGAGISISPVDQEDGSREWKTNRYDLKVARQNLLNKPGAMDKVKSTLLKK